MTLHIKQWNTHYKLDFIIVEQSMLTDDAITIRNDTNVRKLSKIQAPVEQMESECR